MDQEKKRITFEKTRNITAFIASIATIIGVFLGSFCVLKIYQNTVSVNIYGNNNQSTMESELFKAQTDLDKGYYESALEAFMKWSASNSVACNNVGYIYSNGLGVEVDLEKASRYYKTAYNMGNKEALDNYMYINLAKPTSYTTTLSAIQFGYNQDNEQTIQFISMLMTDKLEYEFSETQSNNAREFWDLSASQQKEKLENHLIEEVDCVEKYDRESSPKNTDFTTYTKVSIKDNPNANKHIQAYTAEYIIEDSKAYWIPIYSYREYYLKTTRHFAYSDLLFKESISQI